MCSSCMDSVSIRVDYKVDASCMLCGYGTLCPCPVDGRDRGTALRQLFLIFGGWCVRCGCRDGGSVVVGCVELDRRSISFRMVCGFE